MKRMTPTAVGLAVLIVGLALGASAEADWSSDGTTHLTFEHPVRARTTHGGWGYSSRRRQKADRLNEVLARALPGDPRLAE